MAEDTIMAKDTDTESTRSSLDEQTPLLHRVATTASEKARTWGKSVVLRLLLTPMLVSLSFGVTQVPLIYVFGVMTCSQAITVVGGPAGYLLALNSFATEVIAPAERTGTLGRLQGCAFFGTALGYLFGGILSDTFGIIAPFRVTLVLFLVSSAYILVFLPWIKAELSPEDEKKTRSIASFFEPLKMFVPQKWRLVDGRVRKEYGIVLLGVGAFTALLATGYIPVLLQMYATAVLDFGTTENGWLISVNSLIRGLYLTFAFPAIISGGRKWLDKKEANADKVSAEESQIPDIPTSPEQFQTGPTQAGQEPIEPPKPKANEDESFHFDLLYTRYSILVDGILTALATFTSQGWHMYVVAVVLPLAAGTGSAAKGTILQMCSPSQRADALSAISLVEMVARLATTGLFGFVFSAFAAIGQPSLTFAVNGAVALVTFVIFCFCKFPPQGSARVENSDVAD